MIESGPPTGVWQWFHGMLQLIGAKLLRGLLGAWGFEPQTLPSRLFPGHLSSA
jgi:hypothetical protein